MTAYEQGFLAKCAEAGLDKAQSDALYKEASKAKLALLAASPLFAGLGLFALGDKRRGGTDYGSGIGDKFRYARDHFTQGGMRDVAKRQSQFNYDYNNAGFFGRNWLRMKHPTRAAEARRARELGNYGENQFGS